jgi:hypothetical protein
MGGGGGGGVLKNLEGGPHSLVVGMKDNFNGR